VWDTKNWKLKKVLNEHNKQVLAIAIAPDGKTLYSGGDDKKIIVWSLESFKKTGELQGHFDRVLSLNISKNGKYMASTGGDRLVKSPGNLKIWNLETQKLEFNLETETNAIQDAALSSKGTLVLYAGNFSDAILMKWQVNKIAAKKKITEFGINSVVLHGLQTYLASTYSGDIISWKIGGESSVIDSHEKDAVSVSLSPNKSWLVTGGADGKVKLVKVAKE
ncbi:MAG: WD40 repeat domain-containing protein, partial [Bacteroidia bacterium]